MGLVYLLWIVVVFGGLYMGGGAVWAQTEAGFDPVLSLSALLYLGTALYGLPRLLALLKPGRTS